MRTGDTTYIVVRFQERGIKSAGTYLSQECAELQAESLNERRNKTHEAKWQVQESTYYCTKYAYYMDMTKEDVVHWASLSGIAKSGTKHDIVMRLLE